MAELRKVSPVLDAGLAAGSDVLGTALGGGFGLTAALLEQDPRLASLIINEVRSDFSSPTVTPQGALVQEGVEQATAAITDPVEAAISAIADSSFESTGSPAVGAGVKSLLSLVSAGSPFAKLMRTDTPTQAIEAITPEGGVMRVIEKPGTTGKAYGDTPPTTSTAVIAGKKGDYTKDKFKVVKPTDNLFGKDIGDSEVNNAQIGIGEKGPFLNVGDVVKQNLGLVAWKNKRSVNKANDDIHHIAINLRKSSSFSKNDYLGGKPPEGLDNKPLISLETQYEKGAKRQHFYAQNVNVTGNAFLAKHRIKDNPRLKVEQNGTVYIDTSKSNIIGHIKKGTPKKRGVFEDTANIKVVDGDHYIPIYKEIWTEGVNN